MNKVTVVVLVLLVIGGAVAAGAWIWLPKEQGSEMSEQELARMAFEGSGSATCTFTDAETGGEGTIYIRDGDLRVRFAVDMGAEMGSEPGVRIEHMNSLMINDRLYSWIEGEPTGFEMNLEEAEEFDEDRFGFDVETLEDQERFEEEWEEQQFSCVRGADASMFNLPADVEFVDMAAHYESMMGELNLEQGEMSADEFEAMFGGDEDFERMMQEMQEEFERVMREFGEEQ